MGPYRNGNGLAALVAAMNPNNAGPAMIGADPYAFGAENDAEAMQFGADYEEGVQMGWSPSNSAQAARMAMFQRRNNWCQNHGWTRQGGFSHPVPGRGGFQAGQRPGFRFPTRMVLRSPIAFRGDEELGADEEFGADDEFGEDVLDGVDQEEIGGIDDEVSGLEGDDETFGAEGDEQIGATITTLEHRVARLENLLHRLENKYNSTPTRRRWKRKALLKRITRVRQLLERKQLKLRQKKEKALIKAGLSPAQAAAIAAGGAAGGAAAAAAGISPLAVRKAEGAVMQGQLNAQEGIQGWYGPLNVPGEGTVIELPFVLQSTGEADPLFPKPAGPAGNAQFTLQTDQFSYADFIPLGVVVTVTVQGGQNPGDLLPSALVTNWLIDGGLSQVYGDQTVSLLASQNVGIITASTFLPAMRQTRIRLNRTNTASLTMSIGNKLANAATINFKVEAKLRVRVFTDDNVR